MIIPLFLGCRLILYTGQLFLMNDLTPLSERVVSVIHSTAFLIGDFIPLQGQRLML